MSLQKVLEYFKIVPKEEKETSNVVPFAPVEKTVDKSPNPVYNPKQFRK